VKLTNHPCKENAELSAKTRGRGARTPPFASIEPPELVPPTIKDRYVTLRRRRFIPLAAAPLLCLAFDVAAQASPVHLVDAFNGVFGKQREERARYRGAADRRRRAAGMDLHFGAAFLRADARAVRLPGPPYLIRP
jgi:hypothetical protein